MSKKFLMTAAFAIAGVVATAAPAAAWTQIAERIVTDRMDFDLVVLPAPIRYNEIKLCVYRHPVRVYDFDVNFANGGHQEISVRARINPGGCTRNIDLRGYNRDIASIKMLYEETSWGRRKTATVRLFAR
jgi:hypothetical protein